MREEKELHPDPLTPEQRARFEATQKTLRKQVQPFIDEIRRSEILTAADFAVTINAR